MKLVFKWLIIILVIPVCLAGLCVVIVAGAIFKNSVWHSLDFGSVTDWISAMSSAGTLLIAWKVYRSAPNWFKQKLDESAISFAIDFVEKNATELEARLKKVMLINGEVKQWLSNYQNFDKQTSSLDFLSKMQEATILIGSLDDIYSSMSSLENSLRKRGQVIKKNFSLDFNRDVYNFSELGGTIISNFIEYSRILTKIEECQINGSLMNQEYLLKEIDRAHKKIEESSVRIYSYAYFLCKASPLNKIFI
ncbi:hypothetical protein EKO03_13665 [Enterobacter quasiroggenkampii]|uniref:hypothetical protein n=1 Tax=Enterobacter TaxID=547 RepID=UPI0008B277BD|nr:MULTISPECIES: hypothetical protein [Enterobacter]RTM77340.1 hypothetical protein EKO03_13665 [Enterobacter quasiroggenkampii]SEO76089.1 hypothetical protein SAMN03159286_1966 [Enterobacter sp. NFIX58]